MELDHPLQDNRGVGAPQVPRQRPRPDGGGLSQGADDVGRDDQVARNLEGFGLSRRERVALVRAAARARRDGRCDGRGIAEDEQEGAEGVGKQGKAGKEVGIAAEDTVTDDEVIFSKRL